jgi:hypothetical protein
MDTKRCVRCGEDKFLSEFRRNSRRKGGYFTYCKKCCATAEGRKFREPAPPGHKYCGKCDELKAYKEFHRDKNRKDGFYPFCMKCRADAEGWTYKGSTPEGTKRCSKCQEIKLLSEFNRRKSSKDGYHFRCKKCVTEARGRVYKVPEQLPEGFKRCTKCKEVYPASNEFFHVHKTGRDGLRPDCKKCFLQDSSARQRNNKDRVNEKNRIWRQKNPEKARESSRKGALKWLEKNREIAIIKARLRRKSNIDKAREYDKEYRKNNPDKTRQHQKVKHQRRRAQERKLPYTFTAKDWKCALEYWGNCCAICGCSEAENIIIVPDHWIPISYKGEDNPGTVATNIIPLCHGIGGCNNKKSNRNPVVFLIDKLGDLAGPEKLLEIEAYFEYVRKLESKE